MAGSTSGISPSFLGLSRSSGQVTHVLLTRSRLCPRPKPGSSLHLHVLSTPPAFVLSQDQTLHEELLLQRVVMSSSGAPYTQGHPVHDRVTSKLTNSGRTTSTGGSGRGAHAVEFSKTAVPPEEGGSFQGPRPRVGHAAGRTGQYSAAPWPGKSPEPTAQLLPRGRVYRRIGAVSAPSAHDRDMHAAITRPHVEIQEHDLLPRPQREAAVDDGDRLRRPDQRRAQVRVRV